MGVLESALIGAEAAEKSTLEHAGEVMNGPVLEYLSSPAFDYTLMAGGIAYALSAGATVPQIALPMAIGMGAGKIGYAAGSGLGHSLAQWQGKNRVATEGDAPARIGDKIAHQNKNAGLWGVLAGVLIGAAAAVFVVCTFGTGLIAIGVAAATASFLGAACMGAGDALGEYGEEKGQIAQGSPNVFFNNRAVARLGDEITCSEHPWSAPPQIAEGAKTVFANGKPIARLGHRTTCDGNINSASGNIVETQHTGEERLTIIDSRNLALRWLVPVAKIAAIVVGAKIIKNSQNKQSQSVQGKGHASKDGTTASDPVDVVTGDYLHPCSALHIPGVLPLTLQRVYRSTDAFIPRGHFGHKWADSWSQQLTLHADSIDYQDEEGVILSYYAPDEQVEAINLRQARYQLTGSRSGTLRLFDRQRQHTLIFDHQHGTQRYLSQIEDRQGNQITFHYQQHQLSQIHHSDGYYVTLSHTVHGIESVELIAPSGRQNLLRCQYNAHGYAIDCHSFQYGQLFYHYDQHGHLLNWRDTDCTEVRLRYNAEGQVTALSSTSGHFDDQFSYDPAARCTTYLDAEGGQTYYHYNPHGLVTHIIDPLGHHTVTEWDLTHKISETDALGRTTRYDYNDRGEVIKVTVPDGRQITQRYNRQGQLIEHLALSGDQWQYRYRPDGLLHQCITPTAQSIEYRYDERGHILREIDITGQEWRYEYDDLGQLSQVTQPSGEAQFYQFDVLGRLLSTTNALGNKTQYQQSQVQANPAGSVTQITLPDGTTQHLTYDSERRLSQWQDGEGNTTEYHYGAFDLLVGQQRPDGHQLQYQYDRLTRLTGLTNAAGDHYHLRRDRCGRLIEEQDFTGRRQHYTYDAVGRLIRQQIANQFITYHYTADDRLATVHYWLTQETVSEWQETISYDYNPRGQLIRAGNSGALVEYDYNAQGVLIAETINGRKVTYQRDETTQQLLEQQLGPHLLTFNYSPGGQLTQLQINQHAALTLEHDILGRETGRRSQAGFVFAQNYNQNGLLLSQAGGHDSVLFQAQRRDSPPNQRLIGGVINRLYHYDKAFNVTAIDDGRRGRQHYAYNENNQVIHSQLSGLHPASTDFVYDLNLNLNSQQTHVPEFELFNGETQYKVSGYAQQHRAGRVVHSGRYHYHYNEQGQLCEKQERRDGFRPRVWRYRWNTLGQLVAVQTPEQRQWRYVYDALGRRLRKFEVIPGQTALPLPMSQAPPTTPAPHSATAQKIIGYDYFWCGDQLVEELPLYADGTPAYEQSTHWFYQPEQLAPFARYQRGELHYVITDHLGTPKELLNEWGNLDWAGRHDVWGKYRPWPAANDDPLISCPFRFPGQYEDNESGLHYNRYRYYDPDTAQYISTDPIGLAGGVNPYSYVHNPLSWVDPLGLTSVNAPGYSVYGLFDPNANKPYYVGITNNSDARRLQHMSSGRLSNEGSLIRIKENVTYGQARGLEQYYIEEFKTKTGVIGEPISSTNRGNKVNSFDVNRTDPRGQAFNESYQAKKGGNKPGGTKCG